MKKDLAIFEGHEIRRLYEEKTETWFFSVVDIIRVLTQQVDFQTARKYWNKLKERLGKEGNESVTNCHRLKMEAADGKSYLTDVANAETLLRLVQSVPSPKAEPIKLWLAKTGYERMQEMSDPARALATWHDRGKLSAAGSRQKNPRSERRMKASHSSAARSFLSRAGRRRAAWRAGMGLPAPSLIPVSEMNEPISADWPRSILTGQANL